ncbi:MAG: C/D box methylation guide ribonucleoprotein complex aNOP56 subunit [Nitrososphaerota archaeon]|nr:C/D box methylation guide ribonucleoprotein complex aNOP56 subunit [Nitrososphaerota archaeon]
MPDPILYETEEGLFVVQGDEVLVSERAREGQGQEERLRGVAEGLKRRGISRLKVSSIPAKERMEELGIETSIATDEEREQLDARRASLLAKGGLAAPSGSLEGARARAIAAAEHEVSEASSKEDLHLVNAIQGLDELDRFLNITTERTMEWYSLHFPELQDMLRDNLALAKMVIEFGARGNFEKAALEKQGMGDKKAEAIVIAAERSKGGTISEKDLRRIVGLAELSVKTAAEREKLAEAVESTMKKIAPNITQVAGATIGARLIARAGGMERMARLPASTIQVLGAEKALFRAIRTGSRPPKHGILFQHEAVHTAPKWQRGKIARTLANKIAIAARIDYYRGESAGDLTGLLEKRLAEIKIKYKEPPPVRPEQRREFRRNDRQRPRFGRQGKDERKPGGRKDKRFYKKPRPGQ